MSIPGNGSLNGDLERRGIGCYCEDSLYYWMVHVHREEDFKILERLFSDLYCGSLWLNGYSILESVWEGNLEDIWHLPSDVGDEKERASHMACSMLPHLPAVGEPFHIISRDEKDSKAEHELFRYQNSTVSQWVFEELEPEGFCQKHALVEHLWLMSPNILRDLSQCKTRLG